MAIFLLLAAWLLAGCAPGRQIEAALVLADLAAGEAPSRLKERTPPPVRQEVGFSVAGRPYLADIYQSPAGTVAALLLLPGAAEEGKNDPRLVAFAETLARARFAVVVPDLPSLRRQRVEAGNIQEMVDAFSWMISRPELAPAGRGGMVAFSYAVGPAILAAMESDIRQRVQMVFAIGGYFDLSETLAFITTGWFRHRGGWRQLEPNAYGTWVFVLGNLHRIEDEQDRALLRAMTERKMDDPAAPVDDLAAPLGPEGLAVYALLVNRDPRRTPLLLRELPSSIRAEIAALDLAGARLERLSAQLLLVHGYDDDIIPFSQSVQLAQAVPPEQAEIYLVHGLMHVDLHPSWRDLWRLLGAVTALLRQRDLLADQPLPPAD
ncbi:MAG: alpha/beta hydrolase [Desulfuromonadales bacterium]|nr:alpha/beta hydrolase [Desulfuromonadales bacterium]